MTTREAAIMARALRLLNENPRFGPRDRRLGFDSYSVAAELTTALRKAGHNPHDPAFLPRN